MNKLLALLACLMLASCASTGTREDISTPVLIEGSGKNSDEAIKNGLVRAIEFHSGSVILSDRESHQKKLAVNDVGSYSAGYVEKYTVHQTKVENDRTTVTMEVWVRSSNLANQKLNSGKDASALEGDTLGTQYRTFLADREGSTTFLNRILNDFPSRALVIKQGKVAFKVDGQRNSYIELPITISWNYDYLVALNEALTKVQQNPTKFDMSCMCDRSPEVVTVISRKPGNMLGNSKSYFFNDVTLGKQVRNTFDRYNHIWVRATIYGSNREEILSECYPITQNFSAAPTAGYYTIYGNYTSDWDIEIKINPSNKLYRELDKATRIDTAIVSKSLC
jgi:hypothetical protein|tara:strand:+ start:5091 stop:6098 length:1008 start_codon:yes stop_codon:yes gene_type:complete